MSANAETLVSIHEEARRERLLDMEDRVQRYRLACFGILALALAVGGGNEVGFWWIPLLAAGLAGFAVADRFMRSSSHPAVWIAAAWAALPALIAASVLVTGGATSPVLVWFALPAVTLGFRFEPRGMVFGTLYVAAMFVAAAVVPDPSAAWEERQLLIAIMALIASTVILSGALVESDRAHRHRSTLDPLTGLFNRNALEQRLSELDGQPCDPNQGISHAFLLCDLDHFKRI
ncbi:MAG TPA: diguanylate cyclase, partial [Solirubrobacterales bacterium]|nr:diguanylate cyclase [Solirubrobacterales bacterium]